MMDFFCRIPLWLCTLSLLFPMYFGQAHLNLTRSDYREMYRPMDYAVVGQQKTGTSTLWNVLTTNPAVKWVGYGKEMFFFNAEFPRTTLCDNHVEEYLKFVAAQRLRENNPRLLIGDWSATQFSCLCCAISLRQVNPLLKVVVVLRDPVQRALSRFMEQKRSVKLPFHGMVKNYTFAEFTAMSLDSLEACLARAAPFRTDPRFTFHASESDPPMVGWGSGADLALWMEMQCYARDNMFGWSVYDVFLQNYLTQFPREQILVLYTDNLAADRLGTVRAVENFIGAPPHKYDAAQLSLVYNSRECYSWRCGKRENEIRSVAEVGEMAQDSPFLQALARLRTFYKPHMQRLFRWADQGRIAPVPDAWRKIYGA